MTDCFCSLASTNLLLSCYFRLVTSLRLTRCRERWQAEGDFAADGTVCRNTRRRAATFGTAEFPADCRKLGVSLFCHLGWASVIQLSHTGCDSNANSSGENPNV